MNISKSALKYSKSYDIDYNDKYWQSEIIITAKKEAENGKTWRGYYRLRSGSGGIC
jgi:hypothetical protein